MKLITYLKQHLIFDEDANLDLMILAYNLLKRLQETNELEIISAVDCYKNYYLFDAFLHIFKDRELARKIISNFVENIPILYKEGGYRDLFLESIKTFVYILYNNHIPAHIKLVFPYTNKLLHHIRYMEKEIQKLSKEEVIEVMNEFINTAEKYYPVYFSEKYKEEKNKVFMDDDNDESPSFNDEKEYAPDNEENKKQQQSAANCREIIEKQISEAIESHPLTHYLQ